MEVQKEYVKKILACNFQKLPDAVSEAFKKSQTLSRGNITFGNVGSLNNATANALMQAGAGAQSVLSIDSSQVNISFDIIIKQSHVLALVGFGEESFLFYDTKSECFMEVRVYDGGISSVDFNIPSDMEMLRAMKDYIDTLISKYTTPNKKDKSIFFLTKNQHGFNWLERELTSDSKKLTEELMSKNYGKGFLIHDKNITRQLNEKSSGLYIFNGMQGTGKTSYIQHLIGSINRDFLYVPESLIEILADPGFIEVLMEKENAVLILEDAERAILKRQKGRSSSSGISNLLNMSDGIIGSVVKMPIILTFNSDLDDIDPAILRKGRCNYKHTFDKLSESDAQDLANFLKKDMKITEPTALSDIYNFGE